MFISLEGPEGSGKSVNAAWLAGRLRNHARRVLITREPGGTALGEAIRPLLLHGTEEPAPLASLFLFAAARAELVSKVVRPALESGAVVICDRFTDSTLAYQGYGEGLPLEDIRQINYMATGGLAPDLTILLDIDPEHGLHRRVGSTQWNVIDARALDFHRRVRSGFLALAEQEPERWLVLDAGQQLHSVQDAIIARLMEMSEWPAQEHTTARPAPHPKGGGA